MVLARNDHQQTQPPHMQNIQTPGPGPREGFDPANCHKV